MANDLTPFFNIASVIMILPAAQFLAKFFSYAKYKTLPEEQFERLSNMSDDFLVLGELPIIRGKKVYKTLVTVVTKVGVFSYIEPLKDSKLSRKELLDTEHALNSILKPKNLGVSVKMYNDFEAMCNYLRTTVKSTSFEPDEQALATIASVLIMKTH